MNSDNSVPATEREAELKPRIGILVNIDQIRADLGKITQWPWRWGDWDTTFGEREPIDFSGRNVLEHNPRLFQACAGVRRRDDACERVLRVEDGEISIADRYFLMHAPEYVAFLLKELDAANTRADSYREWQPAAEIRRLELAALKLTERLHAVHQDSRYRGVWACAQLHQGPYDGPTYAEALVELELAVAASSAPAQPEQAKCVNHCGHDPMVTLNGACVRNIYETTETLLSVRQCGHVCEFAPQAGFA